MTVKGVSPTDLFVWGLANMKLHKPGLVYTLCGLYSEKKKKTFWLSLSILLCIFSSLYIGVVYCVQQCLVHAVGEIGQIMDQKAGTVKH